MAEHYERMPIKHMSTRSWGFYYGWIIVAVGLVSMAFWYGIRSSFSVFYVALLEDFPWSRGESAGVQSMALLTYTIMAPLVGGLIDRFGPRRVIVPGILILSTGLFLCGSIESLAQFYIYYSVIAGIGVSCIAIVAYSAILAHWFEKKRGLASGIAVSGMGLGTFVMVPLSQHFISLWGFRLSFILLGILVLIILLPLNGLLLRHKPQELGLYPDGSDAPISPMMDEQNKENSVDFKTDDWTLRRAAGTRRFWALIFFPFFAFLGLFIVQVHNVKFLVDQGIDKMILIL
jgi:MFS family permease